MLILVLAANTAYADFPRLASIVARDGYLPRQFMNQGDRLAFSNGIVVLSVFAAVLLVVFGGDTHALIPLYMIGVFVSFTLSQAGMVDPLAAAARARLADERVHQRLRRDRHRRRAGHRRDDEGARGRVDHHAADSDARRRLQGDAPRTTTTSPSQLSLQRLVAARRRQHNTRAGADRRRASRRVEALALRAAALSDDVRAVYVDIDPAATEQRRRDWDEVGAGRARSSCSTSPYRSLMEPLLEYIEQLQRERSRRLRHGHPAGVRAGALVAAPAAQSARAADQGRAALPPTRRRHQRAVPSEPVRKATTTFFSEKAVVPFPGMIIAG